MVGNESSSFILSFGSVSDWLLVLVTLMLVIVTYLLVRSTNQQKRITEELGKITLLYTSNVSEIERNELELRNVIEPLHRAIRLVKNPHENFHGENNLAYNGNTLPDLNSKFWKAIESNLYLCPEKTKEIISNFITLRTSTQSSSEPPPDFINARENLILEVEERYRELEEKLRNLKSKNSSIIQKIE